LLDPSKFFKNKVKIMDYFIVSKSHKGLAEAISKIFEKDKSVKVIYDRREGQNNNGYEFDRRSLNNHSKIN
tara:strand:- start:12 stop:224 length:213 start_codon:yes stop_codon:yes gene_type:complete